MADRETENGALSEQSRLQKMREIALLQTKEEAIVSRLEEGLFAFSSVEPEDLLSEMTKLFEEEEPADGDD